MKPKGQSVPFFLPLALLGLIGATQDVAGQSVLIDRGTFRITREGREVGLDSFSVLRTGTGEMAKIYVDGDVRVDGQRIKSIVETTSDLGFLAYQADISGDVTSRVMVEPRGRRLEVRVSSSAGEQARELRARDGAGLMEDGVAHHFYFLGALFVGGTVRSGQVGPVIHPRGNDQALVELATATPVSLTIDGQVTEATRLSLAMGGVERRVWIDRAGKVLRVEVPS